VSLTTSKSSPKSWRSKNGSDRMGWSITKSECGNNSSARLFSTPGCPDFSGRQRLV